MNDKIGNTFSDIYAFYYKKSFSLQSLMSTMIWQLKTSLPNH